MFDAYKKKQKALAEKTEAGIARSKEDEALVDSAVKVLLLKSKKSAPCVVVADKETLMTVFQQLGPSTQYQGGLFSVDVKKVGDNIRHVEVKLRENSASAT